MNNITKDKNTIVTINNTVSDHTECTYVQNETENFLIQEPIGLMAESECHITIDNLQNNIESLNEGVMLLLFFIKVHNYNRKCGI